MSFWSGSAFCFSRIFWSGGVEIAAKEKKFWPWTVQLFIFSKFVDFLGSGEFFFWGFKIFWKLRIFVSFLRGFFGVKTFFVSSSRGVINFSKKSFLKTLFFLVTTYFPFWLLLNVVEQPINPIILSLSINPTKRTDILSFSEYRFWSDCW